jgi:hypothetical protein
MSACCGPRPRTSTADDPIVIGDPNGEPAVRARVNNNVFGLRAFAVGWFTGSNVAAAVTGGTLTPV